ncbi:MAG: deoxyribodipyrimidine photo-lyase, partial [Alphaproteobacteria bacterium]
MVSLVWIRRDLRLHDHAALTEALASEGTIQPVFIFDTDVLARFDNPHDRRLSFIARTLGHVHEQLKRKDGGMLVLHGSAKKIVPELAKALGVQKVVAAEDYEPDAIARDEVVAKKLGDRLKLVKDHLIFTPHEVLKGDGEPFRVFTPYSKAWHAKLTPTDYAECKVKDKGRYADFHASAKFAKEAALSVLDASQPKVMLEQIGYKFVKEDYWQVDDAQKRLKQWAGQMGNY